MNNALVVFQSSNIVCAKQQDEKIEMHLFNRFGIKLNCKDHFLGWSDWQTTIPDNLSVGDAQQAIGVIEQSMLPVMQDARYSKVMIAELTQQIIKRFREIYFSSHGKKMNLSELKLAMQAMSRKLLSSFPRSAIYEALSASFDYFPSEKQLVDLCNKVLAWRRAAITRLKMFLWGKTENRPYEGIFARMMRESQEQQLKTKNQKSGASDEKT